MLSAYSSTIYRNNNTLLPRRLWLYAILLLWCSTALLHAHSTEINDYSPISLGLRYDYIEQTHGRQVIGDCTLLLLQRETKPGIGDFQLFRVGAGQFIDSSGAAIGRWKLNIASVNLDEFMWIAQPDTSDSTSKHYNLKSIGRAPDNNLGAGATGGITLIDIDRTQKADILLHWLQLRAGAFMQINSGITIDMRVVPALGLTSYRLGDLVYGKLGSQVFTSYFGVEAGATGTLRCSYRGISLMLQTESSNIFAGEAVHFLAIGARAALVLPPLPIVQSLMFTAEVKREQTCFDKRLCILNSMSLGLTVSLSDKLNPWK